MHILQNKRQNHTSSATPGTTLFLPSLMRCVCHRPLNHHLSIQLTNYTKQMFAFVIQTLIFVLFVLIQWHYTVILSIIRNLTMIQAHDENHNKAINKYHPLP